MTWTTLSYAFGSKLTSLKMSQNQDNFTAVANGDVGAPQIQTAAIAASAVTSAKIAALNVFTSNLNTDAVSESKIAAAAVSQPKLKTGTASGSIGSPPTSYSLTGGTYSWWTGSSSGTVTNIGFGNSDVSSGVIGIASSSGGALTFFVDERYVTASPPYRYGPLFITLMIDKSGNVIGSQIAPDPIWAYHGPTNITPQYSKNGKDYRKCCMLDGLFLCQAIKNPAIMKKYLMGELQTIEKEVEITLEYKDSDAHLICHPFGNVPDGATILLVRPETSLMDRLFQIAEEDHARIVRDLFLNDYIRIDNNSSKALPGLPDNFKSYDAKWRNSDA